MKNIITIQHPQSIHHTNGMVGSWTDWELSELGKSQAENIGRKLSSEIMDGGFVIFSSDLLRTKQTAEIVGRHLGIDPTYTEVLRERNLGRAVGKSVQWLRENMECKEKSVDDKMFSDGESRKDVWNRLLSFYNEIINSEYENIIIISHGDTLSVFNAIWLGLDVNMLNKCDLHGMAGGVSFFVRNEEGKHIIRRLSDMSYRD